MTDSKNEIKPYLGFVEEDHYDSIDETEIIDCIDETLNYLGRAVVYTVYLNWSAVDRRDSSGILGIRKSFRTSLYGLFGDEQGSKIEALLVKKLEERFPFMNLLPKSRKKAILYL